MSILRRNDGLQSGGTMSTLTVVLVVLVIITFVLVGILLLMRRRKRALQANLLPNYSEKRISTSSTHSHHRRIAARPAQSIHIYRDKEMRVEESSGPPSPTNSVPEIRITFPEEVDSAGKRQSGRVVVVHVGDTGIGLSNVNDNLPAYEQRDSGFQSVDLEKVGGLEKETRPPLGWN